MGYPNCQTQKCLILPSNISLASKLFSFSLPLRIPKFLFHPKSRMGMRLPSFSSSSRSLLTDLELVESAGNIFSQRYDRSTWDQFFAKVSVWLWGYHYMSIDDFLEWMSPKVWLYNIGEIVVEYRKPACLFRNSGQFSTPKVSGLSIHTEIKEWAFDMNVL